MTSRLRSARLLCGILNFAVSGGYHLTFEERGFAILDNQNQIVWLPD